MDAKPSKVPSPDQISQADPEPAAVEFLDAALPEHVRGFLRERSSITGDQGESK